MLKVFKKVILIICILSMTMSSACITSFAAAEYGNIITNGYFKENISGWVGYEGATLQFDNSVSYDDNGSALLEKTGPNGVLQTTNTVTLKKGVKYKLSAKIKMTNADSYKANFDIRTSGDTPVDRSFSNATYYAIWGGWYRTAEKNLSGSGWNDVSYIFTYTGGDTDSVDAKIAVRVNADKNNNSLKYYVDDVVLSKYTSYEEITSSTNLIKNGSFEEKDVNGFTNEGALSGAHSIKHSKTGIGSYRLVPGTSQSELFAPAMKLTAGKYYKISANIYISGNVEGGAETDNYNSGVKCHMGIETNNGAGAPPFALHHNFGNSRYWYKTSSPVDIQTGWSLLESTFSVTQDSTVKPMIMILNAKNHAVYIDDFSIEEVQSSVEAAPFANNFETGIGYWYGYGLSSVSFDTANGYGGSKGALKYEQSVSYGEPRKPIRLKSGHNYKIGVKFKNGMTETQNPFIRVLDKKNDYSNYKDGTPVSVGAGEWGTLSMDFTAAASSEEYEVYYVCVVSQSKGLKTNYLDDLVIWDSADKTSSESFNSDFNTGLAGWTFSNWGGAEAARGTVASTEEGAYVVQGHEADILAQSVTVSTGTEYYISAEVKKADPSKSAQASVVLQAYMSAYGDSLALSGENWERVPNDSAWRTTPVELGSNWTKVSGRITLTNSEIPNFAGRFFVDVRGGENISYYIKNMTLIPAASYVPVTEIESASINNDFKVSYTLSEEADCMIQYKYMKNVNDTWEIFDAGYILSSEVLPPIEKTDNMGVYVKAELTPINIAAGKIGSTFVTDSVKATGEIIATNAIWSGFAALKSITDDAVNDGVFGHVSYSNTTGADVNAKIIMVSRSVDGQINKIEIYDTVLEKGTKKEIVTIDLGEKEAFSVTPDDNEISMYLWDGNWNLTPFAKNKTIVKQ